MAALGPVTLRGTHIQLEPMRPVHAAALLEAGRSPEIWEWMPARPGTGAAMDAWLAKAAQAGAPGPEQPVLVIGLVDGGPVASARLLGGPGDDPPAASGR